MSTLYCTISFYDITHCFERISLLNVFSAYHRDIPILRVKRSYNGPEVRGSRPVTVYFEKWSDKDEIMRKAKLLKGSNIYVGEDFSKRVKDHVSHDAAFSTFWCNYGKKSRSI